MPDELTGAAAPVIRLRPDFRPTALLSRTDKSLLIAGDCEDGPAVAKLLTTPEPLWAEKFGTEIDAYQTFAAAPPPVPVPALIAADNRHHVLVIEHVRGHCPVPGRDRFPPQALDPAHVTAMLTAMTDLGRWSPPAGAFTHTLDYLARLDRDHHQGLTTPREHQAMTDLFHQAGNVLVPGHGDPLPTNFVVRPDGQVTVIDWEHAGHYLPGHDLAVLWIALAATPEARPQIEALVTAGCPSVRAAFTLNRAMLLVRELRNHRAVPPSRWRDERVAAIDRDWQDVGELLRAG
ncbi:phosphotransferase family protein [Streptomyces sp. A1-5]|uniref:phosphotransferase family protein n=1 Tax=Streptomyces sp. A1-5 TaxID=2738410 RepID=UPI001F439068|nr:phosphotransferase [Streptomyces sp. A1-5]UJB44877.1 phosphotransferase [Streptomyces sp. A1-5]